MKKALDQIKSLLPVWGVMFVCSLILGVGAAMSDDGNDDNK